MDVQDNFHKNNVLDGLNSEVFKDLDFSKLHPNLVELWKSLNRWQEISQNPEKELIVIIRVEDVDAQKSIKQKYKDIKIVRGWDDDYILCVTNIAGLARISKDENIKEDCIEYWD